MAGKHQSTARGTIIHYFPPADARLRRIGVLRKIPVRIVDLQQVVPHITNKSCALTLALQLEKHVPGRVTRSGVNLDKFAEPMRPTGDQIGSPVFENRNDALTKCAELRWPLFRIGIDL